MSACIGHTLSGNVLLLEGFLLGITGAIGAQLGTRLLQKLPDAVVSFAALNVLVNGRHDASRGCEEQIENCRPN